MAPALAVREEVTLAGRGGAAKGRSAALQCRCVGVAEPAEPGQQGDEEGKRAASAVPTRALAGRTRRMAAYSLPTGAAAGRHPRPFVAKTTERGQLICTAEAAVLEARGGRGPAPPRTARLGGSHGAWEILQWDFCLATGSGSGRAIGVLGGAGRGVVDNGGQVHPLASPRALSATCQLGAAASRFAFDTKSIPAVATLFPFPRRGCLLPGDSHFSE